MYKLLTRSSKLQKKASSTQDISVQRIPSAAGDAPLHQPLVGETLVPIDDTSIHRSKKRKRSKQNGALEVENAEDPLFPSYTVQESSRVRETVDNGVEANAGGKAHSEQESIDAYLQLDFDEDECRRVLKKHKLMVTVLENASAGRSKSAAALEDISATKSRSIVQPKSTYKRLWPQPLTSFNDLTRKYQLSKRVAMNLDAQGFLSPTEVQLGSLPILLGTDKDRGLPDKTKKTAQSTRKSHIDLLTVAPTGSGKTLAFMIQILHGLLSNTQRTRSHSGKQKYMHELGAIVLAPTHEIVNQIVYEGKKLALGTGLKVLGLRKGMRLDQNFTIHSADNNPQDIDNTEEGDILEQDLQQSAVKADVLVSTPSLLLNTVSVPESTAALLSHVRFLVLDEADVLLDPLFSSETLGIWNFCTNPNLQTSLWSATIGSSIESLIRSQTSQRWQSLGLNTSGSSNMLIRLVVGLKDSAISHISHKLIYVASEQGKLLTLRQLLHPAASKNDMVASLHSPFLIFTQTISRAIALHSELLYDIPPEAGGSSRIAVLHSDMSDSARFDTMAKFRKGEIWVLVTTDLLSRGVDFRGVNGVVNYDMPNSSGVYVHRVGRTGRQGREGGVAVTLYTKEDIMYVKNVANVIFASQKQRLGGGATGGDLKPWLREALPTVSKQVKKELKRKGVEARRNKGSSKEEKRQARKMRISTKSGYERRLENRRKGAVLASRRRNFADGSHSPETDWEGLEG